jgi:tRNA A-37 threonylcarbamoyl transferase component Bud32
MRSASVNDQPVHPETAQLEAFARGELEPSEIDEVQRHLADCQSCCHALDEVPDDNLLALVRRAGTAVDADETMVAAKEQTGDDAPTPGSDGTVVDPTASPSVADLPTELAGHTRYRVLELIGKGGMGDVYKAEHRMMQRMVALKVIKRELTQNPQAVERFEREVRAAASLTHVNIVTAYDAERAGDIHFLAMEYVKGIDLEGVVKQRGQISVADACDYTRQAAKGLGHAHEQGMVHRDIKPHNLMLTAEGTVKILDFGLASLTEGPIDHGETVVQRSDLTAVGTIMGTPDYISPEQATDARAADIRSDIYSLGCTFYTLLAGQAPFGEGPVMDKIKAHAEQDAPPLSDFRDDVPAEVETIVQKMMVKDPANRYQVPAAVTAALEPWAAKLAGKRSYGRRRPLTFVAAASLFIAALVAAIVFYIQTDYGVVRVEVADQGLEVKLNGKTIVMRDGEKPLSIRAGDKKLVVRRGEFEFETDSFQVRRGGQVKLKVETLLGKVVVHKDGQRFGEKSLPETVRLIKPDEIVEVGRFTGHDGHVFHAIVSPDGKYGVSGGADKTIRVWDIETQKEELVLEGHKGMVFGLAVSADGKILASGDTARSIRLWDLESGDELAELTGHEADVTDLAFMPDGKHLLSAGFDETLRLWNVKQRKLVRTIDLGAKVEKMEPLWDGRRVMLSGAHTGGWGVLTYDVEKGKKIDPKASALSCLAVSADRRKTLIGSIAGLLKVRDAESGQLIVQMADPRAKAARDAAISPDGRFAVTTTRQGTMHLWDLKEGLFGRRLTSVDRETIGVVSLSPDGRFALTLGRRRGDVGIWQMPERVWAEGSRR